MTDTQTPPQFAALQRVRVYLEDKKVDEQTLAFVMGKLLRVIVEGVTVSIVGAIGEEEYKKIVALPDVAEQEKQLKEKYQAKTGKTIEELREEITEKLVAEFEAKTKEG